MRQAGTEYIKSLFHTPSEFARMAFIQVLRAGHLKAAAHYGIDRRFCAGHDLILCVGGSGRVQIEGREHRVRASEAVWLDGRLPHRHRADAETPWEVMWIRADGAALTRSAEILDVHRLPVFAVDGSWKEKFQCVLDHLEGEPLAIDALLNADLSAILASFFERRQLTDKNGGGACENFPQLKSTMDQMATYFYRKWTVPQLAKMARMSEASFYKSFHGATGSSPIAWLRRQRISQAKRRLAETSDPIKQIAEQVGYADPFYFSRDFRSACGCSPSEYREQESHVASHPTET